MSAILTPAQSAEPPATTHSALPQNLSAFVAENYGNNTKIVSSKRLNEYGTYTYEVKLSNGAELRFNAAFDWTQINNEHSTAAVPISMLTLSIHRHLKSNYPGRNVSIAERRNVGYIITLNDGRKVYYNKAGLFVRDA